MGDAERDERSQTHVDQTVPKCPICRRLREVAFAPFCSRRCADVDLSRWMTDAYVIEGEQVSDDDVDL